jgi:ribonuclease HII
LNASIKGMSICLQHLKPIPDLALIDGNRFKPIEGIPHQCIVKGDRLFQSIAAASILAKTYRDDFMKHLHEEFSHYNWQQNKGYPTAAHRKAIEQFGACRYHRQSFTLLPPQLKLNIE